MRMNFLKFHATNASFPTHQVRADIFLGSRTLRMTRRGSRRPPTVPKWCTSRPVLSALRPYTRHWRHRTGVRRRTRVRISRALPPESTFPIHFRRAPRVIWCAESNGQSRLVSCELHVDSTVALVAWEFEAAARLNCTRVVHRKRL